MKLHDYRKMSKGGVGDTKLANSVSFMCGVCEGSHSFVAVLDGGRGQ